MVGRAVNLFACDSDWPISVDYRPINLASSWHMVETNWGPLPNRTVVMLHRALQLVLISYFFSADKNINNNFLSGFISLWSVQQAEEPRKQSNRKENESKGATGRKQRNIWRGQEQPIVSYLNSLTMSVNYRFSIFWWTLVLYYLITNINHLCTLKIIAWSI